MKRKIHLALAALLALPLYGGGFWLEFGNPKAARDPAARDAILTVRPLGCGDAAKATVTATAEGLVNGRRESVPLRLVRLPSSPGLRAVMWQRPKEGAWVLSFIGIDGARVTGALAPVGPDGFERTGAKFYPHRPSGEEIQAALATQQTLARK